MFHEIITVLMQPFWIPLTRVAVFAVCGYAILSGSWRERFGGLTYMASFVLPWLFWLAYSSRIAVVLMLIADVLCLPGFLIINHKSPHAWTRWALLFQGLSIVGDMADMLIYGDRRPPVYILWEGILSYAVLAALLAGTISAQAGRRRERKASVDSTAAESEG
ncbi:hypothetical protein [Asticcacaulis solisilvae]|uniref:hypothetical protein n=1 Tax=Asticcacaulis solisilvae TaxID=1217274 RepID=UPI003FD6EB79